MEQKDLRQVLHQVAEGSMKIEEALLQIKEAPYQDLGFAKIDHHRAIRQGVAEVIYGAGKTPEQINLIAHSLWEKGQKTILITIVIISLS